MYIYTFILCRKIRKENRGTNTRCLKISKLGKDICQALGPLARNDRRVESWWLQPIPKFWGVILHHPQAVFSYDIVCTCHTACIHNTHIYIYICIYIYPHTHTIIYRYIQAEKIDSASNHPSLHWGLPKHWASHGVPYSGCPDPRSPARGESREMCSWGWSWSIQTGCFDMLSPHTPE